MTSSLCQYVGKIEHSVTHTQTIPTDDSLLSKCQSEEMQMNKHRHLTPISALITPAEGHGCSTVEKEHAAYL